MSATELETGLFGGSGSTDIETTEFNSSLCSSNAVISNIYGLITNNYISEVCAKCSDGYDLGCFTSAGTSGYSNSNFSLGHTELTKVPIKYSENWLENILENEADATHTLTCPNNSYPKGIYGKKSMYLDKLGLKCGYKSTNAASAFPLMPKPEYPGHAVNISDDIIRSAILKEELDNVILNSEEYYLYANNTYKNEINIYNRFIIIVSNASNHPSDKISERYKKAKSYIDTNLNTLLYVLFLSKRASAITNLTEQETNALNAKMRIKWIMLGKVLELARSYLLTMYEPVDGMREIMNLIKPVTVIQINNWVFSLYGVVYPENTIDYKEPNNLSTDLRKLNTEDKETLKIALSTISITSLWESISNWTSPEDNLILGNYETYTSTLRFNTIQYYLITKLLKLQLANKEEWKISSEMTRNFEYDINFYNNIINRYNNQISKIMQNTYKMVEKYKSGNTSLGSLASQPQTQPLPQLPQPLPQLPQQALQLPQQALQVLPSKPDTKFEFKLIDENEKEWYLKYKFIIILFIIVIAIAAIISSNANQAPTSTNTPNTPDPTYPQSPYMR